MTMAGLAVTVALLRAEVEGLRQDRFRVERQVTTWDEARQKSVTAWTTIHDSVPFWLDEPAAAGRETVTDEVVTREGLILHVAPELAGVESDDRVMVIDVGPLTDSGLLNEVMWVTQVRSSSYPVEQLIECRRLK